MSAKARSLRKRLKQKEESEQEPSNPSNPAAALKPAATFQEGKKIQCYLKLLLKDVEIVI